MKNIVWNIIKPFISAYRFTFKFYNDRRIKDYRIPKVEASSGLMTVLSSPTHDTMTSIFHILKWEGHSIVLSV